MPRAAIQLHTLRHSDTPLPDLIDRIAAAGFEGVEFAGRVREASEADLAATAKALERTGVTPIGAHVGIHDLERNLPSIVSRYRRLGCDTLVVPHVSPTQFRHPRRLRRLADRIRQLDNRLRHWGFSLQYHNQHFEFLPVTGPALQRALESGLPDGVVGAATRFKGQLRHRAGLDTFTETTFDRLLAETRDTGLRFEVDVGGVAMAGRDPVGVLDAIGDRLGSVHLKDVTRGRLPMVGGHRSVTPGTGLVDLPAIGAAATRNECPWLVYEHDDSTDPALALHRGRAAVTAAGGDRAPGPDAPGQNAVAGD